jgi:hypothetical protein
MRPKITLVVGGAFFLLTIFPAAAWSSAGHMVIAAEAYRQLTPRWKLKVTEILKAHPEYPKWQESFAEAGSNIDLSKFVFMKASTWPDEIRRHHNHYDHPRWHYIDYPLKPPSFPLEPGPSPKDDVLNGIAQSEKALLSASSFSEERAVYLSYLIHLIGDIHQPLHCASLFNDTYPTGDKGGNDFYVKPGARGIKLHAFWDDLLGTSSKPQTHLNYAIEIESNHPRSLLKELKKAKTPRKWSLESRFVAIEKVYRRGEVKGSTTAETAPSLPESYIKDAKAIAERQAALAGYRLADEIQKCVR